MRVYERFIATWSWARGVAYAAVFMAEQGCTPGASVSLPALRQLEGPVAEATDLNFKPIYK